MDRALWLSFLTRLSTAIPAEGVDVSPEETRALAESELRNLMEHRFPGQQWQVNDAIQKFKHPRLNDWHPKWSAALIALKGTIAEPLIDMILETDYYNELLPAIVDYPSISSRVAETRHPYINGSMKHEVRLNPEYRFEAIEEIAPWLVHEFAMHAADDQNTNEEELMAHLLQNIVLIQLREGKPVSNSLETKLARINTSDFTFIFNSKSPDSHLVDLYGIDGLSVFPGGYEKERFIDINYGANPGTSSGNPRYRAILQKLADRLGLTVPDDLDFSQNALVTANQYLLGGALPSEFWIQGAQKAKLDTGPINVGIEDPYVPDPCQNRVAMHLNSAMPEAALAMADAVKEVQASAVKREDRAPVALGEAFKKVEPHPAKPLDIVA